MAMNGLEQILIVSLTIALLSGKKNKVIKSDPNSILMCDPNNNVIRVTFIAFDGHISLIYDLSGSAQWSRGFLSTAESCYSGELR